MYTLIDSMSETMPLQHLCHLAHIPRGSYYRYQQRANAGDQLDAVCPEVHRVCEQYPRYGYRRVTHELHRRGQLVNHKRILALMRKERLVCRPRRRFVRTTNSEHAFRIYPNVARAMSLSSPNQLWVADITYVRLRQSFVYVAVILDAFSRRVIGWALSEHIDTNLSLSALQMALKERQIVLGLVHHSDQGVQYASDDYVNLLKSMNITISMSRKGNPYDNAKAESFMKTLKAEEVHLNEYETLNDARCHIEYFIDAVYNHKRLHSALGYLPPVEFEDRYLTQNLSTLTQPKTVSI